MICLFCSTDDLIDAGAGVPVADGGIVVDENRAGVLLGQRPEDDLLPGVHNDGGSPVGCLGDGLDSHAVGHDAAAHFSRGHQPDAPDSRQDRARKTGGRPCRS